MLFSAPRTFVQPSAAFTRSGVSGNSRMRLPVALANAFTIAATAGPCAPSPAPSDFSVGRSMSSTSTCGDFLHGQDRIALPITRGDPVAVEANLLVQSPARRLDDTALNLIGEPVRVNDLTRIGDRKGARDLDHAARRIDLDLRDHRDVNRKSSYTWQIQYRGRDVRHRPRRPSSWPSWRPLRSPPSHADLSSARAEMLSDRRLPRVPIHRGRTQSRTRWNMRRACAAPKPAVASP